MSSNNWNEMDWQGGIGTMNGRMKYLLETGFESDVEFLVGNGNELGEKQFFKAHKFVLSMSSSIFAAQFRFDQSFGSGQDKNAPILVIDIPADAFKAMLQFIYTDDISMINKENYVAVYTAAKKYLLHALALKCVDSRPKIAQFHLVQTTNWWTNL